ACVPDPGKAEDLRDLVGEESGFERQPGEGGGEENGKWGMRVSRDRLAGRLEAEPLPHGRHVLVRGFAAQPEPPANVGLDEVVALAGRPPDANGRHPAQECRRPRDADTRAEPGRHARTSRTTFPYTSVSRKSRPA